MKRLTLFDLRAIWADERGVVLDANDYARIEASAATVTRLLASGAAIYGVNTGFGKLASKRIDEAQLAQLQRNLVLSHAVGVGADLPDRVVRLAMALKIVTLAQGRSGVRRVIVDALASLLGAKIYPIIPAQGSVGASGDLAPLAHMSCVLIGEGEARADGERMSGAEAMARAGLAPLVLGPKEGLALLNGTQISTALALDALFRAEDVFDAALVAGAMAVDALKGSGKSLIHTSGSTIVGDHAAGAIHVFDHGGRVAGDIFTDVAGYHPRVGVITAAGGKADDEAHALIFVNRRQLRVHGHRGSRGFRRHRGWCCRFSRRGGGRLRRSRGRCRFFFLATAGQAKRRNQQGQDGKYHNRGLHLGLSFLNRGASA